MIFSFQGAFARSPLHFNQNRPLHYIQILQTLAVQGARAIAPSPNAQIQ
ncbi:MAG: hypothetical protein AAGG51_13790 [Cyanobacteria bacterium P01_G01_bin.54]